MSFFKLFSVIILASGGDLCHLYKEVYVLARFYADALLVGILLYVVKHSIEHSNHLYIAITAV